MVVSFQILLCICTIISSLPHSHALPLAPPEHSGSMQCSKSQVLVLGAGMAGISAGHALTQQGITDFKVVEFQDRIGGRTLHTKFGNRSDGSQWTIELGTNWITGLHSGSGSHPNQEIVNPVWRLAQEVNLTVENLISGGERYYDRNGPSTWYTDVKAFFFANNRMTAAVADRVKHGKDDISVRAGLRLAGWDSTNDMHMQAAEWLIWDADGATSVDLSSLIFGELDGDASEGGLLEKQRFVLDQRGYDIVTRHLASEYLEPDDSRLVMSTKITNVEYSADGVVLRTANDTCYQADYAICTFSLGVLQQAINGRALVTFTPSFPDWKKESVVTNTMGIYTKIFYQFDDVFWPRDVQNFYFADPSIRGYWGLWESLDFPGSPLEGSGIFFATMVWDQSMRIEQQSDHETMQEGLQVLRQMFPNATIPQPRDFLYHRWGMTEWSYGSYSNWALGYTLEQHTNFRANLDRLWFAGEATSSEYWGYLHGAFYEGKWAGQEVANCAKSTDSCSDRKRYITLQGDPEEDYNHTSGFQDDIEDLVGAH